MNQKVSGFTLLEAMVSILLSSLLVLFTFSIYSNFNQYYFIYTQQTDRLNTIVNFRKTFNNDWNNALLVKGSDEELLLTNKEKLVRYEFQDSIVVRNGNVRTTFALIPKDVSVERELNSENVTKIKLELENNNQSFLFSSSKNYGIQSSVNNK